MFKKYLLSSVAFAADGEAGAAEKTPVQAQREAVLAANPPSEKNTVTGQEDDADAGTGEDEGDKEDGEAAQPDKKTDEDAEAAEDDEAETGDEAATEESDEVKKLKRTIERLQKRVGKTAGEKKELADKLSAAEAILAKKKEDGEVVLTEADVDDRAKKIAHETRLQEQFTEDCNKIATEATKVDKDCVAKIIEIAQDYGPMPADMIGILVELDNVGAVMAHLVENEDKYEKIIGLPPAKMAIQLSKLSNELIKPPEKKASRISRATPPVDTPNTSGRAKGGEPLATDDTETWMKKRRAQLAERGKTNLL